MADETSAPEVPETPTPVETAEAPLPPKEEKKAARKKERANFLLFSKWDFTTVEVRDQSLRKYINLDPVVVPHTGARHANKPFGKSKINIVERLINVLMKSEDYTGKKSKAYAAVREAFEIIHAKTKDNPIQTLVRALERAAPREEVTRLKYGGISVPKAVDVAPSRRLDVALRNIAIGATSASFKNPKPIAQCIADEILKASRGEMESAAVARKEELERIAKSAR